MLIKKKKRLKIVVALGGGLVVVTGAGVGMWGGQQVPVLPQRVALQTQPCFTERLDRLGSDIC